LATADALTIDITSSFNGDRVRHLAFIIPPDAQNEQAAEGSILVLKGWRDFAAKLARSWRDFGADVMENMGGGPHHRSPVLTVSNGPQF